MTGKAALLLLLSSGLFAAEFRTGQAARAVFGQSSFTSRDPGVKATSLVVAGSQLFVADSSQRVLTFNLSDLGSVRDDRAASQEVNCAVCESTPAGETKQAVMPGVAAVSVWGKTVAVADTAHHHVLIWRDATAPRLDRGPDVVLGQADEATPGRTTLVNPVSVALDGKRLFVGDTALHRVLVWNRLPVSGDEPADAVLGQADFTTTAPADTPASDSIVSPVAMASDGNDLFVADAAENRVLVFSPADAALTRDNVINSASLSNGPAAPGMLVTIQGAQFTESNETAPAGPESPLPRNLGGVEVIFDGIALPVLAVSPSEVQTQLPYDLGSRAGASLYLRMERGGKVIVTNAVNMKLVPANPGLFALGGSEPRPGILLHGAAKGASSAPPVTEENPARPGEVLTIWATGLGALLDDGVTVAAPITAQINGQPVSVISARRIEGANGVYEVRVTVPAGWRGRQEGQLSIAQNGFSSNTITFPLARFRR